MFYGVIKNHWNWFQSMLVCYTGMKNRFKALLMNSDIYIWTKSVYIIMTLVVSKNKKKDVDFQKQMLVFH